MPAVLGIGSENAAHRVAVEWKDEEGQTREGVYIPRRDTNSRLNQLAGGRVFPGEHHVAKFEVKDDGEVIEFAMHSQDGEAAVELAGRTGAPLPDGSVFKTLTEASEFFRAGSLGYSATANGGQLDGLRLETKTWQVKPLEIERVHSSWFADIKKFPKGSAEFDCALIMRDVEHEWHSAPCLCL